MKFKDVAQTFDLIERESSRTKITVILAELFKKATPHEASLIAYLSLGNIYPEYKGIQFNLAEKSLIKIISVLLDKSPDFVQKKLTELGDLGLVVQQEYNNKNSGSQNKTLGEVYNNLEEIIFITGTGSQERKEEKILELLRELDPVSVKYIVRIIIGTLRMGFSDMTLLDAFSWMERWDKSLREPLEEAYNISVDIGLLIRVLKDSGLAGIKKMSITPGVPIRPAAAERLESAHAIVDKLGSCIAQPKLDGFRLQVHIDRTDKKNPLVRFFSRNLQDMSAMFPDLYQAVLELDVKTLVAEGEAIAYDIQTGSFLPFQETVKRKRKYQVEAVAQEFPLKLYLFDVLYCDGESFLAVSHDVRRKKLEKLLANKKIITQGVLLLIQEKKITGAQELDDYFEQNITAGLEGVVVKRPDALYQAGKRNFNWIKLKRKESGSLDDTIDCVILGYYAGQGKRASFGIGALLVGVYNEKIDCFQTVAKIGTGLTDSEWRAQKETCDTYKIIDKPHNVDCRKELYPDVWVTPTLVCMIRADEITRSPMHTAGRTEDHAGFALRFPRIMGYRPDKKAEQATSVNELKRLYTLQYKSAS